MVADVVVPPSDAAFRRSVGRSSESFFRRARRVRISSSSRGLNTAFRQSIFLETGARNNKLKVYEMVDHPAARALTGYLLVRGGVHQIAYARAIEHLTGASLMKLFPCPRIPTDKIPECRPHIENVEHTKLYRFSQEDFQEVIAVWNREHPETGDELVVADVPHPVGAPAHDFAATAGRLRAGLRS